MADIISSIFGLNTPTQDARLADQQRNLDFGRLYGAATVNTFADPQRQQAYMQQQGAQAALGGELFNAVGGLFGMQSPQVQRATQLEQIMAATQQEVGTNDPTTLYPTLQKNLMAGGFQREAIQVGVAGEKAMQDFRLNTARVGNEQSQGRRLDAQAAQDTLENTRENEFRAALATLPPDASQEEYLAVVRKYAKPDTALASTERAQIAKANQDARVEAAQVKAEADKLLLQQRLEDKRLSEQGRRDIQLQIANINRATKLELAQSKLSSTGPALTTGQKRADAAFGTVYSKWLATGAETAVNDQIKKLDEVITLAEGGANLSGTGVAAANMSGDMILSNYSANALKARDLVASVAQSNLREVLGGQFAQKEGEQLLARAWNPAAKLADNLERVKSLRNAIKSSLKIKADTINYFENNGTLAGYKSSSVSRAATPSNDPLGLR